MISLKRFCDAFLSHIRRQEDTHVIQESSGQGFFKDNALFLIFHECILSSLGKKDLDRLCLVNKDFCQLSRSYQCKRVQSIASLFPEKRLLPATRIRCPGLDAPFQKQSAFLVALERRITAMNQVLPEEFRSPSSPEEMALRINKECIAVFFKNAYLYSLKQCLGPMVDVPETDDLEQSTAKIRSWLADRDLSAFIRICLRSKNLVCFPKELCLFTNVQFIYAENNAIDCLPDEIAGLSQLEEIHLYENPIMAYSSRVREQKKRLSQGVHVCHQGVIINAVLYIRP